MTEAQKQVQIFRETAKREDFINANVGDWIQGVGEITTIYERDFIRRYGSSLISTKSDAVLNELRTLKQYDHIKFYPGKGCLPNIRQIAKISGFSKDGKRVGIEYRQSCNGGVQMSIPISDIRAVCKWIELQQKEREQK